MKFRRSDGRGSSRLTLRHPPIFPPSSPSHLRLGKHDNIIDIECLSDVVGSEGLIMEMAVCDMLSATTGTCSTSFSVSQQLR